MNVKDFTPFMYPQTTYNAPTQYKSHGEFLEAAALRFNITSQLHLLSIVELTMVRDLITLLEEEKNEPADKP